VTLSWDTDNPVTHWRDHIDPLRTNLVQVLAHRQIYREVLAAVESESAARRTWTWRNHYAFLYSQAQAMALRRVVRGNSGHYSLSHLLWSMEEQAEAMTVNLVVAKAREYEPTRRIDDVIREFEVEWSDGNGRLNARIPRRDREALFRERRSVLDWADQTIAHIDPLVSASPTFGDLDRAIDHVTGIFRRYGRLLGRAIYVLEMDLDNWQAALSRPLFPA